MDIKSEFASLSDLAIEKGVSHSQLIDEIHDRILYEYKNRYGKDALTAEVVVNEKTGEVALMQDKSNVTPPEFEKTAEALARQVIIEKLKETPPAAPVVTAAGVVKKDGNIGKWLIGIIFWGYNSIYTLIAATFLINLATNPAFRKAFFDNIQKIGFNRMVFSITTALVPIISIFVAFYLLRKKSASKIGTLFFLFEVPLILISLVFSNMMASPTPFMFFAFLMIILSVPVILTNLLNIEVVSTKVESILLFVKESVFLASIYFALLFSYAVPLIVGSLGKSIFDFFSHELSFSSVYGGYFNIFNFIMTIIFGSMLVVIILALTAAPYLIALYFTRAFLRAREVFAQKAGVKDANSVPLIFLFVWLVFFALAAYQPSPDKYIDKLKFFGSLNSFEKREEIAAEMMPQEAQVKRVFEDLKNVRQRYLMAKSDDYIKKAYTEVFDMGNLSAGSIQSSFNMLAYPLVYQGNLDRSSEALASFEYLFGKSVYDSYYQNTPSAYVNLVNRKIEAVTDYEKLAATITITEEYQNTLWQDQEVIYEFSLPNDTVITGLKLGANLEFPGVIAPKGAAATVYQQEVNKRRDPALLEQTGPTQYRLRVFPVPGTGNTAALGGKNLKVQFTYMVLITPDGYPLPVYSKSQNIKNTGPVSGFIDNIPADAGNNFLNGSSLAATIKGLCSQGKTVNLKTAVSDRSVVLTANSQVAGTGNFTCKDNGKFNFSPLAKNLKIAILMDVSYSNKDDPQLGEIKSLLDENKNLYQVNTLDIYKFNDYLSNPLTLNQTNFDTVMDFTYFGTSDWLAAVNKLVGSYDFVIVATSSKETLISNSASFAKNYPVYIVHRDIIPPYTTKITSGIIQGGGGAFNSFADALNVAILNRSSVNYSLFHGPIFSFNEYMILRGITGTGELAGWEQMQIDTKDPLAVLYAKKYLLGVFASQPGDLSVQTGFLDMTNAYATRNQIITPFSSLISLVNETQVVNLQNQANSLDRYKESVSSPAISIDSPINLRPSTFGGASGGMFGSSVLNLEMKGIEGGSSGVSMMPGGSFSSLALSPLTSSTGGIVLVNILIFGVGMVVFVITKIKRKPGGKVK